MNGVRKATLRTVPAATFSLVAGGVALASALAAFAVAAVVRPYLGDVFEQALVPLLASLVVWTVAGVVRLRLVGFLPSDADRLIPSALQPWIRWWLVVHSGLLGAWLLLSVAAALTALAGEPVRLVIDALIYVVLVHMFVALVGSAALNVGIISHHHSSG